MAQSPFTPLLRKRVSLSSKNPLKIHSVYSFSSIFASNKTRPFSSGSPQAEGSNTEQPPKPSSLSARMSFVFDQIDRIEKQRKEQFVECDDTLQRIRAWRQSKKESQGAERQFEAKEEKVDSEIAKNYTNSSEFTGSRDGDVLHRIRAWRESKCEENKEYPEYETSKNDAKAGVFGTDSVNELGELGKQKGKGVVVMHPWPEWIELMERLVQQNYFDHKRIDEEKMVEELGFDMSNVVEEVKDDAGIDFKDFKAVQTACLNFGKDRFDILRSLSRQDIQSLVGFGCPNADRRVVFCAKLLRKRVHLDEGDVCSTCSLRNSCEKAYLLTNKEDEARTVDVVRVLLNYGFDPMSGLVTNESVLKQKSVKTVVRKLLHEIVKLSAVPIDPNLPPPVIKKPPPKVKQPPPPPKKRVGRDDVEMKKGDWLCPKCDFMNFAKNTVCLQCDAKRPKRQLLPGEWECPECNFLNYRRNMACFHCECKRPPDAFVESKIQEMQSGPRTRLEKVAHRQEVANAWNFDFDDDESDGADVAAFEYADSPAMDKASPSDKQIHGGKYRELTDDFDMAGRASRVHERKYSDFDRRNGFDDFDDEDDIDSYEIDSQQNNSRQKAASNIYSDNEMFSEPEDSEGFSDSSLAGRRATFPSHNKSPKHMHKKPALSGSEDDELDFDSDDDLSVHPNWKSSHVADTKHRGGGVRRSSKSLSFGSDEDLDFDSDVDDDFQNSRTKQRKGDNRSYGRGNARRGGSSDFEGGSFSGRNGSRGSKIRSGQGGNWNSRSRSNTKTDNRRTYFDEEFGRSYRGLQGDNRRFGKDDYGRQRMTTMQKFKGPRQDGGFKNRRHGKSNEYNNTDRYDPSEFSNSRRVIER